MTTMLDKWLEVLESGKYQQTQKVLRDEKGYCCFGVLCDLVDSNKWQKATDEDKFYWEIDDAMPPVWVLELVNLDKYTARKYSGMNDDGESFEAIASEIKKDIRK